MKYNNIGTSTIKAIETEYKGYRFRSRLEARWAVFFDEMGIEWKYEDQGYEREFEDGSKMRYLPDFVLPNFHNGYDFFVEVKGDKFALQKDWERYAEMHDFRGVLPCFQDCYPDRGGLILLGEIPDGGISGTYFHPVLQHHKGLIKNWMCFTGGTRQKFEASAIFSCGKQQIYSLLDICPEYGLDENKDGWVIEIKFVKTPMFFRKTPNAYKAARSARFEHGECGALKR